MSADPVRLAEPAAVSVTPGVLQRSILNLTFVATNDLHSTALGVGPDAHPELSRGGSDAPKERKKEMRRGR